MWRQSMADSSSPLENVSTLYASAGGLTAPDSRNKDSEVSLRKSGCHNRPGGTATDDYLIVPRLHKVPCLLGKRTLVVRLHTSDTVGTQNLATTSSTIPAPGDQGVGTWSVPRMWDP